MATALALLPNTRRDIEAVTLRCRALLRKRALVSAGAALVPIPGLDIATDVGLLVKLITEINAEFGLTPEQIERLNVARRLRVYRGIVAFGGAMVGKTVTQALVVNTLRVVGARVTGKQVARYIPIAGQALAAGLAFAAMKYVGEQHIQACRRVVEYVVGEGATTPWDRPRV